MGSILRCQIDPYRDRKEGPTLPYPPLPAIELERKEEGKLISLALAIRHGDRSPIPSMPGYTPTPQAHSEKNLLHEEAMPCNAMQCNAMGYAERCSDAVLPLRTVSDCNGFAMTASNAGCPLSRGRCGTLTHPKFRRGVRIPRTTQTCWFDRTIMDGHGE